MKRSSVAHLQCSIAQTLEIVGEWWSLLVVRNISFGQRRFEGIQADLGIARNVLSDRLVTLVDHGVLEKVKYQDGPERYEYRLTDKGKDLMPVLLALMAWGDKWAAPDGKPMIVTHKDCGHVATPTVCCSHCGGELDWGHTRIGPGPGRRRGLRPAEADSAD
ncbi:MAG: helix-turn-helix domain-containing protein [Ilumatobacteraceae bacterium]